MTQPGTQAGALRTLPVRNLLLAGAIVVLALVAWRLSGLLLLVFASVLVATLFHSLATAITRRTPLGHGAALTVAVLLVAAVLVGGFALIGTQLAGQVQDLVRRVPDAWARVEEWAGRFDLDGTAREWLIDAMPSNSNLLAHVGSMATLTLGAVANLVIVLAGAVYFAAQPGLYRRGLLRLVPPQRREQTGRGLDTLGVSLQRWLLMQLAAMAIVGTVTGLVLWALGVPSPLALGLIAGLLEFVPIAGPLVAAVPALLVALSVDPGLVLWVALAYLAIQQLEGYVVTPMLAQQVIEIPPALMLFALVAFGVLFGIAGALLAAPLLVVAFVAVREFYVRHVLEDKPLPDPAAQA